MDSKNYLFKDYQFKSSMTTGTSNVVITGNNLALGTPWLP
jgi:hypothetical protein